MTAGGAELHGLAGAFVLDAVTPAERMEFEAHLRDCDQCRADVASLREAAARLGTAEAVRPRPELRAAALRAARQTSQLAPAAAGRPAAAGAGAGRRFRLSRMLLAAAAAVVIVAGAAIGMHYADLSGQSGRRSSAMVQAVLDAPDAVMRTASVGTGGIALVVTSHREHMGVFMARGLHPLPRDRRYEVWLMGPRGDRSAGLLTLRRHGMARPVLVGPVRQGDMVAVTVEPASGSLRPTSAPLVMIGQGNG
ncbi:MAG TPA: anti-sigma factor [Streptosporangiaceae bacterium]